MNSPQQNSGSENPNAKTGFRFYRIPLTEKAKRVRAVFDSVANKYDVMNDLMSAARIVFGSASRCRKPACGPANPHWMWRVVPATYLSAWRHK